MTDVDGTTISNGLIVDSPVVAINATNTRFVDSGLLWRGDTAVFDWPGSTVTFLRSRLSVWRLSCGSRCAVVDGATALNELYADHHLVIQGGGSNIETIGAPTTEVVGHRLWARRIGGEELTIRGSWMTYGEIIASKRIHLLDNTFTADMQVVVQQPATGVISGNVFANSRTNGLLVRPQQTLNGPLLIEHNKFVYNRGDGLRIDVPIPLDITVRDNVSENNGQHGMWATPGTVIDGGGNTSFNDKLGCYTISC
ncbi:right-handed parallel beta-helix repeat-containing protein [Streptomyces sp. ID05-26A]|nr:right-handed parallel beta-helix repeat-containing protein [Streptomyces sp. ID05-26A]